MIVREAAAADAVGIARVQVDTWRTTYRGIMPDDILAGQSYARREQGWRRILGAADAAAFAFVAVDAADRIIGVAAGGPERVDNPESGELAAIYVLDADQGQGVGRRLAHVVAQRLLALGWRSMLCWVAADNANGRRFYDRLGGQPVRRRTVQIGGADLDEVAYVWSDLAALASATDSNEVPAP